MLNSLIRGFFKLDDSPTKVLEVQSKDYLSRPVHYREDAIILYGPITSSRNAKEKFFEIVFQRPFTESLHQMYSLFRSQDQSEAETRFISYKDIIPVYIKLSKECSIPNLQKICDTIGEHTSWTIAHHVALFGLNDMFNEPDVQKHIHDIDCFTGQTPLMVAIETGNFRTVQSLVSLRSPLDKADFNGNNIYHYAALSNKNIITLLATNSAQCLNTYNRSGFTPLHVACSENKPECVRALIVAGADVNLPASVSNTIGPSPPGFVGDVLQDNLNKMYTQDMKFGGTPLHWALSKEVVEVLVDKNCNINSLNFEGRTALHIMALRERLECVVALLSRGAEVSMGDKNGDTPLHLAVKQSNLAIVQALVVFGADLNYKNNGGATPRHALPADMASSKADKILYIIHAVGAERCTSETVGCAPSCSALGDYNGVPPPPVASQAPRHALNQMLAVAGMERASCLARDEKMGRLLCLDGGGIRGLVLVQLLLEMESVMGKPLVHYFDWISGTSTGGILALAMATGRSLQECQCLYFRMKEYAFAGKKPYPSEALESILKECLGTETKMSDIKHPKLMITGILADRKPVDLHIFRNYESAQDILNAHNGTCTPTAEATCSSNMVMSLPAPPPPSSQLVWEAARATGAAPSYFRAFGRYLDGGLVANNPTLDALTELAELRLALRATGREDEARRTQLKLVVSCGTGLVPVVKLTDIDLFRPESLWDAARVTFGVSAIGNLLVDQATLSDGRVVDRARAWCSSMGVPYQRFNPQLSSAVAMDERLDELLVCMLWEAKAYVCANIDRVREVCALLDDD